MQGATDEPTPTEASPVDRALADRQLLIVSNREPYAHEYDGDEVTVSRPAGGLTAALDPVVQRLGGTWIAWGSGSADADVVDEDDRVAVPPEDPAYELRRVWLDDDLVDGYYYGYSNQVLWPLAHSLPSKVNYRERLWKRYREANAEFADAIEAEADEDPVVWFHDYHFGLAPRMVRRRLGEEATLAQFWHIPWPPWDVFRRAPHHRELLDAMLHNDLLGFHTHHDRRQFVDCASRMLDATYDPSGEVLFYDGRRIRLRTAPIQIGIEDVAERADSEAATAYWRGLADEYDLADRTVALGVDRLDYTKGIEERLDALEVLFEEHPEWRGELTYVQKATESRSDIDEYQALQRDVEEHIAAIDDRFGTDDWRPVVYLTDHLSPEELAGLYGNADLALVSPRRDGLNVVAKEYVACQDDGALVLSDRAGVVEEFDDSVLTINPIDTDDFAETIREAAELPAEERRRRITALSELVASTDTDDWIRQLFGPLFSNEP